MKKTAIALIVASVGLQGCGTIHVGNVPFSSKEICSAEYADWYHPNSSCLPPTRAANIQSYFMEEKRLGISGDEARQVDRAAQAEDVAYALSSLQQAVNVSNVLQISIAKLLNSIDTSQKAIGDLQKDNVIPEAKDTLSALTNSFTQTEFQAARAELEGLKDDLRAVSLIPNDLAKIRESLKATRTKLANLPATLVVNEAKVAVASNTNKINENAKSLQTLETAVKKLKVWRDSAKSVFIIPGKISSIDTYIEELQKRQQELENQSVTLKDKSSEKLALEKQIAKLDEVLVTLESVKPNANAIVGELNDAEDKFVAAKESVDQTDKDLSALIMPIDRSSSVSYIDKVIVDLTDLQLGTFKSTIAPNLLPSLIGRVFVADVNHSSTVADGEYLMPGNGGNLELLSVLNWAAVESIQTEVQVNSDISGIVRKQVGVSASFNASQLLEKITTPKITPQIKAVMQASLASLDTGSGSYYYVTMSARQLDELNSKLWDWGCKAHVPPGRGDAMLMSRSPYPELGQGEAKCNMAQLGSEFGVDVNRPNLSAAPGMGVIVGAAILRTRKGTSEICSTMEITLSSDRNKLDSGKGGSVCSELRSILEGSGVHPVEISAALATVNAAYRSESYKTMLIHDHASVLAIHWIPIKLK